MHRSIICLVSVFSTLITLLLPTSSPLSSHFDSSTAEASTIEPQLAAGAGTTTAASQPSGIDTKTAADDDPNWRNTTNPTHDGADRTPMLYKTLAQNNKVDTQNDEMRLDFIVRVAHGEVDTDNSNPGIRMLYDYGDRDPDPDYGHSVPYNKTLPAKSSTSSQSHTASQSYNWASNINEGFTILKVVESGHYDYLVISFEGDLNYPDNGASAWSAADKNGLKITQNVYVMVGPAATNTYPYTSSSLLTTEDLESWPLTSSVVSKAQVIIYPGACPLKNFSRGCGVPQAFVGWDGHPSLWSGGQANWGLLLDTDIVNNYGTTIAPAGTAPANSFFVEWYDPAANWYNETNPCLRHTSFKYQWFGLQNGTDWVPITDLTPTAKTVTGQPAMYEGTPPQPDAGNNRGNNGDTNAAFNSTRNPYSIIAKNDNGVLERAQNPDGSIDFAKAVKDQKNYKHPSMPGLDGYFKLVTWAVNPEGCDASTAPYGDVDNPYDPSHPTNPGVTVSMAKTNQREVERQIESGWTVDTAFYQFDIKRPATPAITNVTDSANATISNSQCKAIVIGNAAQYALGDIYAKSKATHPSIHGTGTPGDSITLYSDQPDAEDRKVIDKTDPENIDSQGTLVGTTVVKPDGTWTVNDPDPVTVGDNTLKSRRYHAYQTEINLNDSSSLNTENMERTSKFSPIALIYFHSADIAPTIDAVTVPHTHNGQAIADKVTISGTVTPKNTGSMLKVYASVHKEDTDTIVNVGGNRGDDDKHDPAPAGSPAPTTGSSTAKIPPNSDLIYTETFADTGEQPWKVNVDPSWFINKSKNGSGKFYTLTAALTNTDGDISALDLDEEYISMFAPIVVIDSINGLGISGHITSAYPKSGQDGKYSTVHITWPAEVSDLAPVATQADEHGYWHFDLPDGLYQGSIDVQATDLAHNESAKTTQAFTVTPEQGNLPTTGASPQTPQLLSILFALAAAIIVALLSHAKQQMQCGGLQPPHVHAPWYRWHHGHQGHTHRHTAAHTTAYGHHGATHHLHTAAHARHQHGAHRARKY